MKTPVKPKDSFQIVDKKDGNNICLVETTAQRDYIVTAINSHEKLVEVKRELRASDNWLHRLLKSCVIFLDDGEVTKRAVKKQSRYNQQVLKEAE